MDEQAQIKKTLLGNQIPLDSSPSQTLMRALRESGDPLKTDDALVKGLPGLVLPEVEEDGVDLRPYRVLEQLGEGGMGVVELVEQRSLGREVALKRLKSPAGTNAQDLLKEARIAGGLGHPDIIPIHEVGWIDDVGPVVVMKRVEGREWSDLLAGEDAPDNEEALLRHLEILIRVCNAVHYAHTHGVVHRDLKPENVMLGEFGELYVLDWGIALEMGAGDQVQSMAGTPVYMAPEMVAGDTARIDARSDVFLMGAILHEIITRTPRHAGTSVLVVMFQASLSNPVDYPAWVPPELAAIANRACHRDPEARYQSARSFQEALSAYLNHRNARMIERRARTRLESLGEALECGDEDASIQRLFNEARFGFEQALEIWSEMEAATQGLRATLEQMLEYELGRGNAMGAQVLLAQMEAPDPEVCDRVERLVQGLAQDAQELASLRYERDPHVSLRQRFLIFALGFAMAVGAVFATYLMRADYSRFIEPLEAVKVGFLPLALTTIAIPAFRKAFFANEHSGRLVVNLWILTLALGGSRLMLYLAGHDTLTMVRNEYLLFALFMIVIPRRQFRSALWVGVLAACLCAASYVWLEPTRPLHHGFMVLFMFAMLVEVVMNIRKRDATSTEG